ncbi:hypothetical protein E4U61_002700 [Claviceps capensis]|nr:hypothetical protein E4U61_002700 [Claviceps capensis]
MVLRPRIPPGFCYDMANMDGYVLEPFVFRSFLSWSPGAGQIDQMVEDSVAEEDEKALKTIAGSVIKEKQPFVRLEMAKDELLETFKYSKYKEYFINPRVPEGTKSTAYRCGPLIDLCRGPNTTRAHIAG